MARAMVSVLGKRARQDTSISSQVKRRSQTSIANDENADPNVGDDGLDGIEQDSTKVDEFDPSIHTSRRAVDARRIALSPTKANGQSKIYETLPQDDDSEQLPTPKTPRHRDALSKRIPITPRHRAGLVGKQLTPSCLRTPSTPGNAPTVYNCARELFISSTNPGPLIGREEERKELYTFIKEGIESKAGRCMYVSGPPGTGKSALVREVCQNIHSTAAVRTAYINCMSTKNSKDIYGRLIKELLGDDCQPCPDQMAHLRAIFIPRKKDPNLVYVVTLDEIDHLLTLGLEILYTLFEWSLLRSSRLVIIGIANALDLTDQFLPRLKARNLKPQLLPFLPYTAPQIASVITTKLTSLSTTSETIPSEYVPFLHPTAIQLCSKKVASQTGDLRKAFEIVRRAMDLIETEIRQEYRSNLASHSLLFSPSRNPLEENPNLRSPTYAASTFEASCADLTPLTAPRATIAHVSRVSAAALSNGTSQRLQILNLQQKAALCALLSHHRVSRKAASSIFATPTKTGAAPSVRKLYEAYCILCKREKALHPLTSTEFADVVSGLETLGLVGDEKGGRVFGAASGTLGRKGKGIVEEKRVVCFVDEEDVKNCLNGVGRGILLGLLGCDA